MLKITGAAVLALAMAMAGCDQFTATSEGKLWTITASSDKEAPRLTMKTALSGADPSGKPVPLELELSGTGGSGWGGGAMAQMVEFKLTSTGGVMLPEGELLLVPNGQRRSPFGGGMAGAEVRQTPTGTAACPTFTAYGSATMLRMLIGSDHVDGSVGPVKFTLDDERVRAMATLLRRIDATVPK